LTGDSSNQDYKLSSSIVEVGEVKFNDWVQREIYLENTGKVTFAFKVLMQNIERKGLVEVWPLEGKVLGQEKFKFTIKLCPGFPDIINEIFYI
jgi:hydrocephalus-inducing protein